MLPRENDFLFKQYLKVVYKAFVKIFQLIFFLIPSYEHSTIHILETRVKLEDNKWTAQDHTSTRKGCDGNSALPLPKVGIFRQHYSEALSTVVNGEDHYSDSTEGQGQGDDDGSQLYCYIQQESWQSLVALRFEDEEKPAVGRQKVRGRKDATC